MSIRLGRALVVRWLNMAAKPAANIFRVTTEEECTRIHCNTDNCVRFTVSLLAHRFLVCRGEAVFYVFFFGLLGPTVGLIWRECGGVLFSSCIKLAPGSLHQQHLYESLAFLSK